MSGAATLGNGSSTCLELIGSQITLSAGTATGTTCVGRGRIVGGALGGPRPMTTPPAARRPSPTIARRRRRRVRHPGAGLRPHLRRRRRLRRRPLHPVPPGRRGIAPAPTTPWSTQATSAPPGGAALASNIAQVVENNAGSNWADDAIVVNNGPSNTDHQRHARPPAARRPTPTAATARPYRARPSPGARPPTCGAACGGGGVAGKFVTITATHNYTPIFSSYGIVQNGAVTVTTTVETS